MRQRRIHFIHWQKKTFGSKEHGVGGELASCEGNVSIRTQSRLREHYGEEPIDNYTSIWVVASWVFAEMPVDLHFGVNNTSQRCFRQPHSTCDFPNERVAFIKPCDDHKGRMSKMSYALTKDWSGMTTFSSEYPKQYESRVLIVGISAQHDVLQEWTHSWA